MKVRRTLLAAALAAAVLGVGTATAHADTFTASDPRGDVDRIEFGAPARDTGAERALSRRANGDITGVRVTHTATTVRVHLRFRDLARSTGKHLYQYSVRTPGATWSVAFEAGPGGYAVDPGHPWRPGPTAIQRFSDQGALSQVPCSTVRTLDFRKNTARLVIPRQCLDKPDWVRVAAEAGTDLNRRRGYFDYAMNNGTGHDPRYTPRVFS